MKCPNSRTSPTVGAGPNAILVSFDGIGVVKGVVNVMKLVVFILSLFFLHDLVRMKLFSKVYSDGKW